MQYYILMSGDTEEDAVNEANLLGEESMGNFWPGSGFNILFKILECHPESLDSVTIKTDQGKEVSVTKFVDKVSKLNLKRH